MRRVNVGWVTGKSEQLDKWSYCRLAGYQKGKGTGEI